MSFIFNSVKLISKRHSIFNVTRYLSNSRCGAATNSILPPTACTFLNNPWIWQKQERIDMPVNHIIPLQLPNGILINLPQTESDKKHSSDNAIDEPLSLNNESKQAARLIVIRRKKMKKHKLKKLRKRMKYENAKIRQRRELKKEKEFQAGLIAQCREAEAFIADEYVLDKLKQAKAEPPLSFYDSPEFKELMRIKRLGLNVPE